MKLHESDRLAGDRNLDRGIDTVRSVTSKRAVLNQAPYKWLTGARVRCSSLSAGSGVDCANIAARVE